MKIVMLNGNPHPEEKGFDDRLALLAGRLGASGHLVSDFTLRELKIRQCVGCFGCWVKSPGLCMFKDDQEAILRAYLTADLVLMASPLIMGFTSALLKRFCDRIIPVALPYIDGSSGECRHYPRYEHTPLLGVLYAPEADTDDEELEIVADLWHRLARNGNSHIAFFRSLDDPAEEVCYEINRA